jgi:hypothetical protein
MDEKAASLSGALISVELAKVLRMHFVANVGPLNLFRCPQCHQRVEVLQDRFTHVEGTGPCPLSDKTPA